MKFSLLSDDMIVYIRNSKELKKKENPNAFNEVTGFKINKQSVAFLYTNNEHVETKIKTMQFTMQMKEIKEDSIKWRDVSSSWIGSLHTVKMSVLSK